MLHEVLLALSGHPSPVFDDTKSFPNITAPEAALLQSLGRLASLHRALRGHVARISSDHPSIICRAVASSIASRHLTKFQGAILEVERRILRKDATSVGAYDVVPLASVVGDLNQWHRPLEWYWDISCSILAPEHSGNSDSSTTAVSSGPAIISKLRQETVTGYTVIEEAAQELSRVAESTWLRQLSTFLMSNEPLDKQTEWDFFIQSTRKHGSRSTRINRDFLPEFLSTQSANTILHVARTSPYISGSAVSASGTSKAGSDFKLACIRKLSQLQLPISQERLNAVVSEIRLSLSTQLKQSALPPEEALRILQSINKFFFLRRVDFADALIEAADEHLRTRHAQMNSKQGKGNHRDLVGIMMREGELNAVLSKAWAGMSNNMSGAQTTDEDVEWAREHIALKLVEPSETQDDGSDQDEVDSSQKQSPSRPGHFSDLLLSTSTALFLNIRAPLDLLLSTSDTGKFNSIFNYLMAIRRAQLHLTALWHEPQLRKGAAFSGDWKSSYKSRMFFSQTLRKRFTARVRSMRPIWAVLSITTRIMVELGEYLISDVLNKSWRGFENWASNNHDGDKGSSTKSGCATGSSDERTTHDEHGRPKSSAVFVGDTEGLDITETHQDPEAIAQAHKEYLHALTDMLMLNNDAFVKSLRLLLIRIDHIVAVIRRLQSIQSKLDLADEGVDDGFSERYEKEEREVTAEIKTAAERVDESRMALIQSLKTVAVDNVVNDHRERLTSDTGFEPWRKRNLDRLLINIDIESSEAGAK